MAYPALFPYNIKLTFIEIYTNIDALETCNTVNYHKFVLMTDLLMISKLFNLEKSAVNC